MEEYTQVKIYRPETEQTSSLWSALFQSDAESKPVFVLAESFKGQRVTEIRFSASELAELSNTLGDVKTPVLEAAKTVLARVDHTNIHTTLGDMRDTWNLLRVAIAQAEPVKPETHVLYVGSLYWRDCDPLLSVAGFDEKAVSDKLAELAKEELEEAIDRDMTDAEDGTDESDIRANLESELFYGASEFNYPADIQTLGIDQEHKEELEKDGLTIY